MCTGRHAQEFRAGRWRRYTAAGTGGGGAVTVWLIINSLAYSLHLLPLDFLRTFPSVRAVTVTVTVTVLFCFNIFSDFCDRIGPIGRARECAEHGLRGEPFAQKLYGFSVFFHDFLGLQQARQPRRSGG